MLNSVTVLMDEPASMSESNRSAICPACGTPDDFKTAIRLGSSFNLAAFVAGGILAVLFCNAGREKRVQCNKCGAVFGIRTPLSIISRVFFWLLVAPTIIVLVLWLLSLARYLFRGGS
jgi:hypothetical protein